MWRRRQTRWDEDQRPSHIPNLGNLGEGGGREMRLVWGQCGGRKRLHSRRAATMLPSRFVQTNLLSPSLPPDCGSGKKGGHLRPRLSSGKRDGKLLSCRCANKRANPEILIGIKMKLTFHSDGGNARRGSLAADAKLPLKL